MATNREHPDTFVEISVGWESVAFDEGRASAKIGMALADCPYLPLLEEDRRKAWVAGYCLVSSIENSA